MTGPLAAVETVVHVPTGPVAHAAAKIIHAMNVRAWIETAAGMQTVTRGDVLVLATGSASSTTPNPWLRSWIVYVDEGFLRQHMRWAIPEHAPLVQGVPPTSWDGSPLRLRLDPARLSRLEPILRRMSLTNAADSYTAASTAIALFAQAVEIVTPAFLANGKPLHDPRRRDRVRRAGTPPVRAEVRAAMAMIEERLAYPWRMSDLASAVALSSSQLTRLSHRLLGATPLQMQAELRVTEFTRLIEETDLTITVAARSGRMERPERGDDPIPATLRDHPVPLPEGKLTARGGSAHGATDGAPSMVLRVSGWARMLSTPRKPLISCGSLPAGAGACSSGGKSSTPATRAGRGSRPRPPPASPVRTYPGSEPWVSSALPRASPAVLRISPGLNSLPVRVPAVH